MKKGCLKKISDEDGLKNRLRPIFQWIKFGNHDNLCLFAFAYNFPYINSPINL